MAHIWYTRRIPSQLGMLLDISRRNLDRVLYFAQYIVTYVDEEARKKALKRLEDEISVSEREQAAGRQCQDRRDQDQARPQDRRDSTRSAAALEQGYDEHIAEQLDPIIKEGQKLEKLLQDQMGAAGQEGCGLRS